jgi:ATPase subunit of ABC transporter with duplicated ATPase domains
VIENALMDYRGAILAISHDRYFLDKISINRILTLQNGMIIEKLN